MQPNRLHFSKQSEAAPVAATQAGDVAVGLRGTDFISIPVELLGSLPVQSFDAAASDTAVPLEVIPFTRVDDITSVSTPAEWQVVPTTNVAKTSLKKAAATVGDTSVAAVLAGHLPATGKFWFVAGADAGAMDAADLNWVEINLSRVPDYLSTGTAEKISNFGFGYDYGWIDAINFSDALTGARKYLVCLDIDTGVVDIYASNGLTATKTFAAVNGQPALAGAFINCAMYIYDGAAAEMTFSVTGADTPYAIPGGYLPLATYEATSTNAQGSINKITSNSVLRDVQLVKGRVYYVDKTDNVFELPVAGFVPLRNQQNRYSAKQFFDAGVGLEQNIHMRTLNGGVLVTNSANGLIARMEDSANGANHVIGQQSLNSMTSGQLNVVVGSWIGSNALTFTHSVAIGYGLGAAKYVADTVGIGRDILGGTWKTQSVTAIGATAANVTGYYLNNCTIVGYLSMSGFDADTAPDQNNPTEINGNTVVGGGSFYRGKPGSHNTIVGAQASTWYGDGTYGTGVNDDNVVVGYAAFDNRVGNNSRNVVLGRDAMAQSRSADENVVAGLQAGYGLIGHYNVAVGSLALKNDTLGSNSNTQCTAVGDRTMRNLSGITNSAALGANATVTGSNQVQLGDSNTTTYAYGAVQNRSDSRDKREVRDTVLGLDFVLQLRPVDYKLDLREDYVDYSTRPQAPEMLRSEPQPPQMAHTEPGYQEALIAYQADHARWLEEKELYDNAYRVWAREAAAWDEANRMANIVTDGSKMRKRFHHGFIAQEVAAAANSMGIDFGGYQDHSINGGQDVRSLGYEEFVAPSIRAIQELHELVNSDEFVERIAAKVLDKMMAARTGG